MHSLARVLWLMERREPGWKLYGWFVGPHCRLTVRTAHGMEICRFRLTWPDYLAAVTYWIEKKEALRKDEHHD